MNAPELLLTMTPLEALKAQIGYNVKAPLKSEYLKIEKPVSLGGLRTQVTVSVDKTKAPVELWDRVGSGEFTYDRIDLGEFTRGLMKTVHATPPVSAGSLLRHVLSPYAIPLASNDLVEALYTSTGPVDVLANEQSWRWIGETRLTIAELGIEITPRIRVNRFTFSFTPEHRSADIEGRLISMINMANAMTLPIPLVPSMVTLGPPMVNGPEALGDNTMIELTFNGSPYLGVLPIYYGRRAFPDTFRWSVKLSGRQLADHKELAIKLGDHFGCDIESIDIRSAAFPAGIGKHRMVVNFDETSLAYVGAVLVEYDVTS